MWCVTPQVYNMVVHSVNCLDLWNKIVVDPKEVLSNVNIRYRNKPSLRIKFKDQQFAKLLRPNHPNNCLLVDISKLVKTLRGFQQIQFNFLYSTKYQVEVKLSDKKRSTSRNLKTKQFGVLGPRLFLSNLARPSYRF